jgi:hypothetical protein
MRRSLLLFALAAVTGCGGSTPEPAAPAANVQATPGEAPSAAPVAAAAPAPKEPEPSQAFGELPTECAEKKDGLCLPPQKFVRRLCSAAYPDVALAMFQKSTPWTRGYLKMNVEAWYAAGGQASSDKLVFDEEVLVLFHRAPDKGGGGMQVSGSSGGGYDVLRWDGTCASLFGEELTLRPPPGKAKFAKIPYKNLDESIRAALEANDKVGKVVGDRRKECKAQTIGDLSAKCAKADEQVSGVVVDYVRGGGAIPAPAKLP